MQFRVIDSCPFPRSIAPYFAVLKQDVPGSFINSGYRGEDAKAILHAHGKHSQAEIFKSSPPGVANPPGYSSHELRSDGNPAYHGKARGQAIPEWQCGIDINDQFVSAWIGAARKRGWTLMRPYSSGVEFHHLIFSKQPRPQGPRTMAKLVHLRATLPKS
jgi:hypothetical protein